MPPRADLKLDVELECRSLELAERSREAAIVVVVVAAVDAAVLADVGPKTGVEPGDVLRAE